MKKTCIGVLTAIVLVLTGGAADAFIVADHGGYHRQGVAKDSTKSKVLAWRTGAQCAETDIRKTVDGYWIESHDDRLDHATNGEGLVSESTWAYIRTLELSDGQHVPSLSEAMRVAANHGHKCILAELKTPDWTAADFERLQQMAVDRGLQKTFRLYLARPPHLALARDHAPKIKVIWKCTTALPDDATITRLSPKGITVRGGGLYQANVDRLHGLGVQVWAGVGHTKRAEQWQRLPRLGVNGGVTNYPKMAAWMEDHA